MSRDHEKEIVARAALECVQDGMTLGLGSGSTAEKMIRSLGGLVQEGLSIRGVPTSRRSAEIAIEHGIPIVTLDDVERIDLTIDGADEIDRQGNLIKGGGGALLREKVVAQASEKLLIIGDSSKLVDTLGAYPLPVEIIAFAASPVKASIWEMGGKPQLRLSGETPWVTDEGHQILDCDFGSISDPSAVASHLDQVPGVMEHGLFIGMATRILVAEGDQVHEVLG